jgi:hypothetical protein
MLKTFCNDKPQNLTVDAFYDPIAAEAGSQVVVQRKRLPFNTASILDIRKSLSMDYLNTIWKEWKDEDEDFDDFMDRVQTWPDFEDCNLDLICLVDPNNPQYSFPDFVSIHDSFFCMCSNPNHPVP